MFGWLSGCTAALVEGPVQQLQVHWHASRFHSRDYCAAADKFCWRHVLLSPHTNRADLVLWGNFRGCTFIEKTQKAQCFWTLSTPLPACYSAALLLLSKSGASQKPQMSTPEARVCRWSVQQAHCLCVCSNITETQAIQGQKSIRSFRFIHGMSWINLRMVLLE